VEWRKTTKKRQLWVVPGGFLMPGKPKKGFLFKQPWTPSLCPEMIEILGELSQDADVMEIGGGASTLFLHERAKSVYTIENDQDWGQCILDSAGDMDLSTLKLVVVERSEMARRVRYARNDSFDLIFIDCLQYERWNVAVKSLNKVRPGGHIIIDDVNMKGLGNLDALFDDWGSYTIWGKKPHPVRGNIVKTVTTVFQRPE